MLQSFSYSVTTCLPRESVWRVLTKIEEWPKFSCVYRDVKWVGEEWVLGSSLIGHLNYPIPIPFRYLLKDCIAPELIRYLADSPELGFANERTIRLEEVSCGTLIRVDAYTVGEPVREIPGGSLGFLKMLTEKWFFDFAHFCDNDCLQSPNCRRLDSTAAAEQDSGKV